MEFQDFHEVEESRNTPGTRKELGALDSNGRGMGQWFLEHREPGRRGIGDNAHIPA